MRWDAVTNIPAHLKYFLFYTPLEDPISDITLIVVSFPQLLSMHSNYGLLRSVVCPNLFIDDIKRSELLIDTNIHQKTPPIHC